MSSHYTDHRNHAKFCHELIASLNPDNALEHQFAYSVAEDSWRLNRSRGIEVSILARPDAESAEIVKQLQFLSLYQQRLVRIVQVNLKQLHDLQAERRVQRESELEQAGLLAQLSLSRGMSYNPASDGFVFSSAEINLAIDRGNRLNEARSNVLQFPKPKVKAAA